MIVLNILAVVVLAAFPNWRTKSEDDGHKVREKEFPSERLVKADLALVVIASTLALISTMWQHIATVAAATSISTALGGAISHHVGSTSMGLGWAAVGGTLISTLAVLIFFTSIRIFNKLSPEDWGR